MAKETQLQTQGDSAYLALRSGGIRDEVRQANNVGELTAADLPRVKFPTGGAQFFQLPSLEGTTPAATIKGVILHSVVNRAYWPESFEENPNQPPMCTSKDGKYGEFFKRGCAECEFNAFGSAKNGGKACKERRPVALLVPDKRLPLVVSLPTMSLVPFRNYMISLENEDIAAFEVETQIALEPAKNKAGIAYSKATFSVASRLSAVEIERVKGAIARLDRSQVVAKTEDFVNAE